MKKKVFSLLMIFVMVLSLLPASVFADGEKIDVSISYPNAASAKLYAASDTGMEPDLLSGKDHTATASVEAGSYKLALYNDSSACLGTIMLDVSLENKSFTVYAVSVNCGNEGWVCGTDYTISPNARSGGSSATVIRTITLGDDGKSFPCISGDNVTATIVPSGSEKSVGFASASATNGNDPSVVTGIGFAQLTGTCYPASSLTVSYPYADTNKDGVNDFILEVGTMSNYYIFSYSEPVSVNKTSESNETATFMAAKNTAYFYKVSNPLDTDAVTYGNYVTTGKTDGTTAVEVTEAQMYIGNDSYNSDTVIRDYSKNEYDSGDIYLASNAKDFWLENGGTGAQGVIRLDTSDNKNCTLYPYRNWLIIESTSNAKVIEPDFHVQVINLDDSNPIKVTENTANDAKKHSYEIQAQSAGTAVLLITYDAITADQAMGNKGKFFSAIRPENTGVIVVTVNGSEDVVANMLSPTEKVNTEMNESGSAATGNSARVAGACFDAELDRLYFYTDAGASYSFTPESGTTVTMAKAVQNGTVSFSAEGVSKVGDTITLSGIPEGKSIVKLENGDKISYQVIRATRTNVTVKDASGNIYYDSASGTLNENMMFVPGEKVTLSYSKLEHPAQKLSGIYNMSCTVVPYGEGITVEKGSGFAGVYTFNNTPANWTITATIPESVGGNSYELTSLIRQTGFGSYYGDHRFLEYETGKTANFTAVQQNAWFGGLPDVSLPIASQITAKVVVKDSNNQVVASSDLSVSDAAGNAVTLEDSSFQAYTGKTYSYTLTVLGHPRVVDTFSIPTDASGSYEIVLTVPEFKTGSWDGIKITEPSVLDGIYQIGTGEELAWFAAKVNGGSAVSSDAALTADIDLSNMDWTPIGNSSNKYAGNFDGNGHVINGLYINATTANQGLFGCIGAAKISNLGVYGSVKSTESAVGGIVGCGDSVEFTINNCFNAAAVIGSKFVGGIVGSTTGKGSISNCYNLGYITAGNSGLSGGINGSTKAQTCTVATNCYNLGTVNCPKNGGAINPGAATKATNSYYLDGCYVAGTSSKAGNSKTSEDLKDLSKTLGDAFMKDVDSINKGYPVLTWQHTHSLTRIEKTEPTCIADGNIEYWSCACGKYFSDEAGKTEISESALILPAVNYHELKTLTFEGEKWNALIDDPQYGGELLYGSGMGFDNSEAAYQWTDTDNTNLHSVLSEVYGSYCFWNGGHAVSHYVSGDASSFGDYESQLTVFKSGVDGLETSGGGNNGSDNFAVHYGYTDNSGYAMLTEETLPSLSFADGKARVIDSMYVNNICYALNAYINGNDQTEKIGKGDWVKIVATGYNGTTETETSEFYLCNGPENIVTDWTKWDLSGLGKVTKVTFNITGSSDNGNGFSQPAYFAYDDVAVRLGDVTYTTTQAATCTEDGNSAYWYCDECEKYYSDAALTKEIEKDSWIIKAQHILNKTNAKSASCTAAGSSAYWTCGVCGKYFSDEAGNTEIKKDSWIIQPTGHKDGNSDGKCDSCGADLSQPVVDNRITVYYTVLGDDKHGNDGSVHTLKNGGLTPWVARRAVEVEKNSTVWDVMVQAASDLSGKISYANSSGNYVSSITFDGETLAEFDNGGLSGWMYTLNGTHPGYGVAQQKVSDGDVIVFHYTDDYTQEEGSEKWNEPYTDPEKKDETKTEEKKETVETKPVEAADGKAEVIVESDKIDKVIENLIKSDEENQLVEIKAEVKGDANEVSVGLPTASLSKLAEKTEATVDVQTPNGNVAMPSEALKEIVSQAGKENIEVKVENKAPEDVKENVVSKLAEALKDAPAKADGTKFDEKLLDKATVVDIKISAGDKNITGFNGNSITVSVPVDAKKYENGKYYRSFIQSSDGSLEAKAAHITGGNAEVETSHLSTFVITEEEVSPFIDIDIVNDWFAESVTKAFEKKIINGVGGNMFDAYGTFTRAMIVQVLYNLEGKPVTDYKMTFTDVTEGAWYADAVRWAQSTGIVEGYPGGRFDPNGAVTREQTALVLMRYAKYKKLDVTKRNELNEYPDMSKISPWALDAVKWANALKLIIGSDNKLNPTGDATRAEAVTILVRFIENVR